MIPKKTRVMLKRVMWVFIPAVLVFVLGIGSLSFYFINRLTHPAKTQLYGSPRDLRKQCAYRLLEETDNHAALGAE